MVVKYKEQNTKIVETEKFRMEYEEWTGEVAVFDTDQHLVFLGKISDLQEISIMLSKLVSVKEEESV